MTTHQEFLKNGGGDVNALVDILKQVEAGQIRPEYLHKDQRKSLDRRNSLERWVRPGWAAVHNFRA